MLKKENRFKGRLLGKTRSFTTPLFTLKFANDPEDQKKFSFIVSKKIDRRAVIRNRLKRIFREALYELIPQLDTIDGVFYIKKEAIGKTKNEAFKNIKEALETNKLLK